MRNADMPAMPITLEPGEVWSEDRDHAHGLTKREHFAATINIDSDEFRFSDKELLEEFIGRNVDDEDPMDLMRAAVEVDAKFRVMKADALLAELEKSNA